MNIQGAVYEYAGGNVVTYRVYYVNNQGVIYENKGVFYEYAGGNV